MRSSFAAVAMLAGVAALVAATPAYGDKPAPWQPPFHVKVNAASGLVGDPVHDATGHRIGTVAQVMIDMAQGRARWLLVESEGAREHAKESLVVPWSAVVVDSFPTAVIRLKTTLDELERVPRLSPDHLRDLTSPESAAAVAAYYRGRAREASSGSSAQALEPMPSLLVDRLDADWVLPPSATTPAALRAAEIELPDGSDFGDIDHVVLERDSGRIAYLLVARGGFLGMGEDWVPVPYEALRWSTERQDYVLEAPPQSLRTLPKLIDENLPGVVRQTDLAELYRRFGITPFWDRD